MRFTRLISAITLVAAVTVLGSCGQSSAPTATSTTDPSANLGPREYTISPSNIGWDRGNPGDPIPTDTKTVLIGGIIPLASYPSFGAPVYDGGANNWLDINTTPNFSRTPMGWIVSFKLKPAAQFLPEGSYTATIPVTVPAALNNPQMITVSFGCHQIVVDGPYREGNLTTDSPRWDNWGVSEGPSGYNNSGDFAYQDWCVTVPAGERVYVSMQGSDCVPYYGYTLEDPYLYIFTLPDHQYVTSDDDSECGLDSYLSFTNNTEGTKSYLVRTTSYDTWDEFGTGTFRVQAYTIPDLRMGDGTATPRTKVKHVRGQ